MHISEKRKFRPGMKKYTGKQRKGFHNRSNEMGNIHIVVSGKGSEMEFLRIRNAIRALERENNRHSDSRISHDINLWPCN